MENRNDAKTSQSQADRVESPKGDIVGEASITVDVPVAVAFAFWRQLENLPRFMKHVNKVKEIAPNRYTWVVDGPIGTEVSWEAITTRIVENEVISWQSIEGSEVVNSGSVHFSPTPSGTTQIQVKLAYTPPAGKLGHAIASLFGKNPEQQISDDLETLKSLLSSTGTAGAKK